MRILRSALASVVTVTVIVSGSGSAALAPASAAEPAPTAATASPQPLFETVDLAHSGDDGAHTYRIPALETLPDGTLIAAYDRRNDDASDLPGDIDVVIRRSYDQGRTWTAPQIIAGTGTTVGSGDPSLIVDDVTGRIFVFYATGNGFFQSPQGNDNANPNLIHTDYSYSDDGGVTWTVRRITADIKDPDWYGIFASSGTGIQIKHGPHQGRLVQQYTLNTTQSGFDSISAASAYSDDHGETWQMGGLAGPAANENKTVELADGRLMMNSRTTATPSRLVSVSDDAGQSWGPLTSDPELVDPGNNAAIIRGNEDATADQPESHILLFSNTAHATARQNLTVRVSCNDGATWPLAKTVEAGPSAYSTILELNDGTYGMLYERGPYAAIVFARFNNAWLGADCPTDGGHPKVGFTADPSATVAPGQWGIVDLDVTNHSGFTTGAGQAHLSVPAGWSVERGSVEVPPLAAGENFAARFIVTAPAAAQVGTVQATARLKIGATNATTVQPIRVKAPPHGDVWASDLEWIYASNGWGPAERNTSNGGQASGDGYPMVLDGSLYLKGIGAHASGRIRLFAGGNCDSFTATVGVDDTQQLNGSVTFSVLADGALVTGTDVIRFSDPAQRLVVDVSGAQYVDLVVGDGGNHNGNDHADWAEAQLHCAP